MGKARSSSLGNPIKADLGYDNQVAPKVNQNQIGNPIKQDLITPRPNAEVGATLYDDRSKTTIDPSKYEKYMPYGVYTMDSLDKVRASEQGLGAKLMGFLGQAVIGELIGGTIEGLGAAGDITVGRLADHLNDEEYQFGNFITELGKSIREKTADTVPIYQQNPGESWQWGDTGWWAQNLVSVASGLSMLAGGTAVTKGIGWAAKLANVADKVGDVAKYWGEVGVTAGFMRNAEAMRDATDTAQTVKDKSYQALSAMSDEEFERVKAEQNEVPKDLTRAQFAEALGNKSGWTTYKLNSMNYAFDLFQVAGIFKAVKGRTRTGIISKDVEAAQKSLLNKTSDFKPSVFDKYLAPLSSGFSEAPEEMINYAAGQAGERVGTNLGKKSDNMVTKFLEDAVSDKGLESGFFGVLGGKAFNVVGNFMNKADNKQAVSQKIGEIENRLETARGSSDKIKAIVAEFESGTISKEAAQTQISQEAYKVGFDLGSNAAKVGNVDLLLETLDSKDFRTNVSTVEEGTDSFKDLDSTVFSALKEGALRAEQAHRKVYSKLFYVQQPEHVKQALTDIILSTERDSAHLSEVARTSNEEADRIVPLGTTPEQQNRRLTVERLSTKKAIQTLRSSPELIKHFPDQSRIFKALEDLDEQLATADGDRSVPVDDSINAASDALAQAKIASVFSNELDNLADEFLSPERIKSVENAFKAQNKKRADNRKIKIAEDIQTKIAEGKTAKQIKEEIQTENKEEARLVKESLKELRSQREPLISRAKNQFNNFAKKLVTSIGDITLVDPEEDTLVDVQQNEDQLNELVSTVTDPEVDVVQEAVVEETLSPTIELDPFVTTKPVAPVAPVAKKTRKKKSTPKVVALELPLDETENSEVLELNDLPAATESTETELNSGVEQLNLSSQPTSIEAIIEQVPETIIIAAEPESGYGLEDIEAEEDFGVKTEPIVETTGSEAVLAENTFASMYMPSIVNPTVTQLTDNTIVVSDKDVIAIKAINELRDIINKKGSVGLDLQPVEVDDKFKTDDPNEIAIGVFHKGVQIGFINRVSSVEKEIKRLEYEGLTLAATARRINLIETLKIRKAFAANPKSKVRLEKISAGARNPVTNRQLTPLSKVTGAMKVRPYVVPESGGSLTSSTIEPLSGKGAAYDSKFIRSLYNKDMLYSASNVFILVPASPNLTINFEKYKEVQQAIPLFIDANPLASEDISQVVTFMNQLITGLKEGKNPFKDQSMIDIKESINRLTMFRSDIKDKDDNIYSPVFTVHGASNNNKGRIEFLNGEFNEIISIYVAPNDEVRLTKRQWKGTKTKYNNLTEYKEQIGDKIPINGKDVLVLNADNRTIFSQTIKEALSTKRYNLYLEKGKESELEDLIMNSDRFGVNVKTIESPTGEVLSLFGGKMSGANGVDNVTTRLVLDDKIKVGSAKPKKQKVAKNLAKLKKGEILDVVFTISGKSVIVKAEVLDWFNQGKNIDHGGKENILEVKLRNVKNGKEYVFESTFDGEVKSQYFDGKTIANPDTTIRREIKDSSDSIADANESPVERKRTDFPTPSINSEIDENSQSELTDPTEDINIDDLTDFLTDGLTFKASYNQTSDQVIESNQQQIDNFHKVVGEQIPIELLPYQLMDNGDVVYGVFKDAAVKLSKYSVVGTEYHEAFHAIFNMYFNGIDQLDILEQANKKYVLGEDLAAESSRIRVEEHLAEKFRNFMISKEVETKSTGILDKIEAFFDKLHRMLQNFFGKRDRIDRIFEGAKRGDFKNSARMQYANVERFGLVNPSALNDSAIRYRMAAYETLMSEKVLTWYDKQGSKLLKQNKQVYLDKLQKDFQIPKAQFELVKDIDNPTPERLAIELMATYSYAVEVKVAKENADTFNKIHGFDVSDVDVNTLQLEETDWGGSYLIVDADGNYLSRVEYTKEEADEILAGMGTRNTATYANLTVPGGTNYQENEIATPDIIPAIKGHAQFSTNNGIGWFRSDDANVRFTTNELVVKSVEEIPVTEFTYNKHTFYKNGDSWFEQLPEYVGDQEMSDIGILKAYTAYSSLAGQDFKTRRILELQSDLFQKGRGYDDLTSIDSPYRFYEGYTDYREFTDNAGTTYTNTAGQEDSYKMRYMTDAGRAMELITKEQYDLAYSYHIKSLGLDKGNSFLQLLNKDNNWVGFFIKSIVQDSAKKGYEKVLFPSGETAAKVEGHETIAAEILKYDDILNGDIDQYYAKSNGVIPDGYSVIINQGTDYVFDETKEGFIEKVKKEKELLKTQGLEKLKPIEGFYEVRVKNFLTKNYPNAVTTITDEYGNTWNEVDIAKLPSQDVIRFSKAQEGQTIPDRFAIFKPEEQAKYIKYSGLLIMRYLEKVDSITPEDIQSGKVLTLKAAVKQALIRHSATLEVDSIAKKTTDYLAGLLESDDNTYWQKSADYVRNSLRVDVSNDDNIDTSALTKQMMNKLWDDTSQTKTSSKATLDFELKRFLMTTEKVEDFKFNVVDGSPQFSYTPNRDNLAELPEVENFSVLYSTLSTQLADSIDIDEMMAKILELSKLNPTFALVYQRLKNNDTYQEKLFTAFNKPKVDSIQLKYQTDKALAMSVPTVSYRLTNAMADAVKVVVESYNSGVGKSLITSAKVAKFREWNIKVRESLSDSTKVKAETKKNILGMLRALGITITKKQLDLALASIGNKETFEKKEIVSISEVEVAEKLRTAIFKLGEELFNQIFVSDKIRFDEQGRVGAIASFFQEVFLDVKEPSFYNANRELQYSLQKPLFINKFFSGLAQVYSRKTMNKVNAYNTLVDKIQSMLGDDANKYSNWLNSLVAFKDMSLRDNNAQNFKFQWFNGLVDLDTFTGKAYNGVTDFDWSSAKLALFIKEKNYAYYSLPVLSDSGNIGVIKAPVYKGYFNGELLEQSDLRKALLNIIYYDLRKADNARRLLFENKRNAQVTNPLSIEDSKVKKEPHWRKDQAIAQASNKAIAKHTVAKSDNYQSSTASYLRAINGASESFNSTDSVWVFGAGTWNSLESKINADFESYYKPTIDKAIASGVTTFNIGKASGIDTLATNYLKSLGFSVESKGDWNSLVKDSNSSELTEEVKDNLLIGYHYQKLDADNNPILLDESGRPTGRIFQTPSLTYTENGKVRRVSEIIGLDENDNLVFRGDESKLSYGLSIFNNGLYDYKTLTPNKRRLFDKFISNFAKAEVASSIRTYLPIADDIKKDVEKSDYSNNLDLVSDFILNSFIAQQEISALFNGVSSQYKSVVDHNKRSKQLISPTQYFSTKHRGKTSKYIVIPDVFTTPDTLQANSENLAKAIVRSNKKYKGLDYNHDNAFSDATKNILEQKVYDLMSPYLSVNATDGQGFITLEFFENLVKDRGIHGAKMKNLIAALRSGREYDSKYLKDVLQILKPYYFNNTVNPVTGVMEAVQIKTSVQVLIPGLIKGTVLESLLSVAPSDLSHIYTESAVKDGRKRNSKVTLQKLVDIDIDESDLNIQTLDNSQWGLQLDVPEHLKDTTNNLSIQAKKALFSNIPDSEVFPIAGTEMTGKQLHEQIQSIFSEISNRGTDALVEKINNPREVSKIIEKYMDDNNLPEHYKDLLQINEAGDNFVIPLSIPAFANKFQSLLIKPFLEKGIKVPVAGGHATLLSDAFITNFININDIDFNAYSKEAADRIRATGQLSLRQSVVSDGKTKYVKTECLLPAWTKKFFKEGDRINLEDLPVEARELLGHRTPLEGKYSFLSLECVGFLPEGVGSTIVLPAALVAQTGHDFDVDSEYLIFRYLDKDNKPIAYDLSAPLSEWTDKQMNNFIFDSYQAITEHPSQAIEHIVPSTMDEVKQMVRKSKALLGVVEEAENHNSLATQDRLRSINMMGRSLKGVAVSYSGMVPIAQKLKLVSDSPIKVAYDPKKYDLKELKSKFKVEESDGKYIVSHDMFGWNKKDFTDPNGDLISMGLAKTVANVLDIVKEGTLLNLNLFTGGNYMMLRTLGVPLEEASLLLIQPVVLREFAASQNDIIYQGEAKDSKTTYMEMLKTIRGLNNRPYIAFKDIPMASLDLDRLTASVKYFKEERPRKYSTATPAELDRLRDEVIYQLGLLKLWNHITAIGFDYKKVMDGTTPDRTKASSIPELMADVEAYNELGSTELGVKSLYSGKVQTVKSVLDTTNAYTSIKTYADNMKRYLDTLSKYFIDLDKTVLDATMVYNSKYSPEVHKKVVEVASFSLLNNKLSSEEIVRITKAEPNTNTKMEFAEFKELSTANKLWFIKYRLRDAITETNILYHLSPKISEGDFNIKSFYEIKFDKPNLSDGLDRFMSESFGALLESDNEFLKDLGEDLIKYNYITQGFAFSGNSFANYIPVKYLVQRGWLDNLKSANSRGLEEFDLDYMTLMNLAGRNGWKDDKLSKINFINKNTLPEDDAFLRINDTNPFVLSYSKKKELGFSPQFYTFVVKDGDTTNIIQTSVSKVEDDYWFTPVNRLSNGYFKTESGNFSLIPSQNTMFSYMNEFTGNSDDINDTERLDSFDDETTIC